MRSLLAWTAVLLCGGLTLHLAWPGAAEEPAAAPPTRVPGPALMRLGQARPGEPPAPGVQATAMHAAASTRRPTVVDLCGLGRMPVGDTDPVTPPDDTDAPEATAGLQALPAPVGEQPLAQARARMLATLRQGDARARVAALLLDRPAADDPAAQQAWAGAVLSQALGSGDPAALAWATEACGPQPDPAACRINLIRERLRAEPDNGYHWAALADEDPAAGDAAWRGLLQARRWLERPQALVLASQAALPADLPGYLRLALGADVRARSASLPSPGEGFVLERCQQAQPGRREQCDALAALMQRSDALQTLTEAASVAQAAGWPAERLQQLRHEFQDLVHAPPAWQADADQPLACASVDAWQHHLTQLAQVGELATLRAAARAHPATHPLP
ncbi:hypothetical protein ACG04R_07720 [Roseateles sp. BYS78W]|uniref:Secreted protein n=1 Tax=Pelomonas candidula TaxID=3299025 RepID=A0ABW7H9G4_9BURK